MKIANVKTMVAKVMMVGVAAGAFMFAGTTQAKAQGFGFGVEVGYPQYDYGRRDYYNHVRAEEFRRHQEFIRQQEFERSHRFRGPYGWR